MNPRFPQRNATLTTIVIALSAGTVLAGATVDLVPRTAGPYAGGSIVTVDVALSNHEDFDVELRFVQLDFSASDPALTFASDFDFDFSTLVDSAFYIAFPELPVPAAVFVGQ